MSSTLLFTVVLLLVANTPELYAAPTRDNSAGTDSDIKAALDTVMLSSVGSHPTALERKQRQASSSPCISYIYVSAHTSTGAGSGTNDVHDLEIRAGGTDYIAALRDMPGNQASPDKGDLWKLSLANDFSPEPGCITKTDVQEIAIEEAGNDGWKIDSIITIYKYNDGEFEVATLDMDVGKWIDGDGDPQTQPGVVEHYSLTLL